MLRFTSKGGAVDSVALPGAPFSHYYAQEPSDEGIIMETNIAVKQVILSSDYFVVPASD